MLGSTIDIQVRISGLTIWCKFKQIVAPGYVSFILVHNSKCEPVHLLLAYFHMVPFTYIFTYGWLNVKCQENQSQVNNNRKGKTKTVYINKAL